MKPIQFVLVGLLAAGLWVYFRHLRSRSRDRLIVLGVVLAAMTFVIMPGWSSQIAAQLGVGRGVDLVIYISLMALGFVCLVIYSQLRFVKGQLTILARQHAIAHARRPEEAET